MAGGQFRFGQELRVDVFVSGEHALHVAEFGGALAGMLAEGCTENGVVEEFCQLSGESLGVAGFEGEAGGA